MMQERIEDKRRRLPLLERSLRNAVCVAFDPFRECFGAARGPRANIPDPTAAPHDENDSLLRSAERRFRPLPILRSGRESRTSSSISHQIPGQVIEADSAAAHACGKDRPTHPGRTSMTEALATKTCTPCRGGVPPLTREQADCIFARTATA
jgi:hypothetical protein